MLPGWRLLHGDASPTTRTRLKRFGGWLLFCAWLLWAFGGILVAPSVWLWLATVLGPMLAVFFVLLWDSTGDDFHD